LNHIDCFVSQSRYDEYIEEVVISPYAFINSENYYAWDKVGEAIGNLQGLNRFRIHNHNYYDNNEDEVVPIPDWEILARILKHVGQDIAVHISDVITWDAEKARLFARAIRGHPTITGFEEDSISQAIPDHPTITGFWGDNDIFPYESLDAVYSALATLPAPKSVKLSSSRRHVRPEDESALAHPESLTGLLRILSLRSVCFNRFDFTHALCQATASALVEGTAVTKLEFRHCSFPPAEESTVMMTKVLTINTSVSRINVVSPFDGVPVLYSALAAALASNSTVRHLELVKLDNRSYRRLLDNEDPNSLSPVLLVLGKNTGSRP
jgi:hypothetical protein